MNPDKRSIAICKNCNTEFKYSKHHFGYFCSLKCFHSFRDEKIRLTIEHNQVAPNTKAARKFLLNRDGNICNICDLSEWNKQSIPLVCDHIDGNSENMVLSNLRMICCNCDAQTPTYKNKNKGNGRYLRRKRAKEGLSF